MIAYISYSFLYIDMLIYKYHIIKHRTFYFVMQQYINQCDEIREEEYYTIMVLWWGMYGDLWNQGYVMVVKAQ